MTKKKIIISGLSLLFLVGLSSCNGGGTPATTTPTSQTATTVTKPSDTLKLTRTYTDSSNFVDNGIGNATLVAATDGDTATFKMSTKSAGGEESVRIRFQDIDTPESTGTVEKWGKQASKFTEEKLTSATSIVLESPTTPAGHDSYGERYLGWVWYKTATMTEYKNLNLEIVENGFSESKATGGNKYDSEFIAAQSYARTNALHIWSDEEDPYYNDNPTEVTIKELAADLKKDNPTYYDKESGVGSKVAFVGYVKSMTKSTSGTYSYVAEAQNEDGTFSTINLYAGYSSDTINDQLHVGYLFHFVGSVQLHYSNFQIAVGGTYVAMTTGPKYTYRLQKDYLMTFNSSNENLLKKMETSFRSNATVTAVSEANGVLTVTANVLKKSNNAEETEKESFTFKIPTPENGYSRMVVGAIFSTKGYQKTKDSKVIEVLSYSDISFK